MPQKKKRMTWEEREDKIMEVDRLMSRGIKRPSEIAKLINVSPSTSKIYMDTVEGRWKKLNVMNIDLTRVELMKGLDEREKATWEILDKCDNSSAQVGCINALLAITEKKAWVSGASRVFDAD